MDVNSQQKPNQQIRTPIWQARAFNNWVRTVLISATLSEKDSVCELCCAGGQELGKWDRAKVGFYVGVDANPQKLQEAESRWIQKSKPFEAQFKVLNPYTESLARVLEKGQMFDIISCFDGLQMSFESEEEATTFLRNVGDHLQSGGYFIGDVPDSSAIWHKAISSKKQQPCITDDLFSIYFYGQDFKPFGTKYLLRMTDGTSKQECMIHFPTLIKLAKDEGLTLVTISNFEEFYEDNKRNFEDQLKALKVPNKEKKIEKDQMAIISLYTVFIFQKI